MTVRRAVPMLGISLLTLLSSCALGEGASAGSADLDWLWGLIGVVALFVLGGVVYKIRHPKRPTQSESRAVGGRIVVKRGKNKHKQSGPYDYGPKVQGDPSSDPEFFDFDPQTRT